MLAGWQEGHPACKKTNWWGAGMVMCLKRGVDLHMAKLMSLPLAVSCFSKIQIGFTFLLLVYPGSPRQRAIKSVCVCERERESERQIWQSVSNLTPQRGLVCQFCHLEQPTRKSSLH